MPGPPAFIPGESADARFPLDRFLPPHPQGSAQRWLAEQAPPGSWVLDPFGASPALAVELARGGYRVLVTANNPIVRFVLELLADPPTVGELQAALAHLAASRVGDERLEPHLLALYNTPCGVCGALVSADEFLWEKGAAAPFARVYRCDHCGFNGESPATPYDADHAARTAASRLTYARILERVAALQDPDRRHAEEAIRHYPARAVGALGLLVNKLDAFPAEEQRLLSALLLHAFDQGSSLWGHPSGRARPRQLTTPAHYRERNVFRALEQAVGLWGEEDPARLPVTIFPERSEEPGSICIFEGRVRDLAHHIPELGVPAIVTALPRPNQAFWTLSALWAGWLQGRAAVEPFKAVLRRQRYDWRWHATALHAALASLQPHLPQGLPVFALAAEAEPGFVAAALAAGEHAGLALEGVALREADAMAQVHWRTGPPPASEPPPAGIPLVEGIREHLAARGEPAGLLPVLIAGFQARARHAASLPAGSASDGYAQILAELEAGLTYRSGFLRFNAGKELDAGSWWLRTEPDTRALSDRIEAAAHSFLFTHPGCTADALDHALCSEFPGLFTPDPDLLGACLASYGELSGQDQWRLRPEDDPETRRHELDEQHRMLLEIGARLGFHVEDGAPILWSGANGAYRFHLTASAELSTMLLHDPPGPGLRLAVLPGGRANLVLFKRRRDPRLDHLLRDWSFLKFRHLRALHANPQLNAANFHQQLLVDPLTYESPQLKFI